MIYRLRLAGVALAFTVAGCNQNAVTAKGPTPQTNIQVVPPQRAVAMPHLDHAQPKLQTIKLWIGPEVLETELALRPVEISTGMMFRKDMGENEGMLFAFARPYRVSFYMKNTQVPLSAAYIDPEGRIVEIHDLQPLNEEPVYAESDRIQYVLEVKQGWFQRHHVAPGTLIKSELGTLAETFQSR